MADSSRQTCRHRSSASCRARGWKGGRGRRPGDPFHLPIPDAAARPSGLTRRVGPGIGIKAPGHGAEGRRCARLAHPPDRPVGAGGCGRAGRASPVECSKGGTGTRGHAPRGTVPWLNSTGPAKFRPTAQGCAVGAQRKAPGHGVPGDFGGKQGFGRSGQPFYRHNRRGHLSQRPVPGLTGGRADPGRGREPTIPHEQPSGEPGFRCGQPAELPLVGTGVVACKEETQRKTRFA